MTTLARQLAQARALPTTPGDHRAARQKAKACTALEVRQAQVAGRKWRREQRREPYTGPF